MFNTGICTLVLLAVASVNGSPTSYDKRDPQFSVNLPNRLPTGNFNGFNITRGANGNSVVNFGSTFRGQRVNGNGGSRNATGNGRPFPFNFLPFKRDEEHELVTRDPQFSFNFPNRLPVEGNFGGFNITRGPNGNSIVNFGSSFRGQRVNGNGGSRNRTTNGRPFPFNFLPFKRDDEVVKRDPQFSVNLPGNRLPTGNFNGFNITRGANGNSVVNFGSSFRGQRVNSNGGSRNTTTNGRPFPFNFLPFKRDDELVTRDPQFSVNLPSNRLPTGNFNGFNITRGANGNSVVNFGSSFRGQSVNGNSGSRNTTSSTRPFPFNFLPFKRDEESLAARDEIEAREPQFSVNLPNRLPVDGKLPFGLNIGQGANGNSVASFGNATTGDRGFPFSFLPFKREESDSE